MGKIFTPLQVKSLNLKNRLTVSAMVTMFNNKGDASISEEFMTYHEEKAKGGFGLIITEDYIINPLAGAYPFLPGMFDDKFIEPNRAFTERIHKAGGKIAAQIYHAGRQSCSFRLAKVPPVAPSPIPSPMNPVMPKELTKPEISALIEQYAQAARRVKESGFDAVEIHGGHGYLIHNFISPLSNVRTDEYGGSIYNRSRFALEVVKAVRQAVGEDFPIIFRISAMEDCQGGVTIEESKTVAMLLEKAGVDIMHCSHGSDIGFNITIPPGCTPKAAYIDNAAEMKKVLNIPVIGVGRINEPILAEQILQAGKADLVVMGRASIADPQLPNKAMRGELEDINYCIGCVQGCVFGGPNMTMTCAVNPHIGRQSTLKITPTAKPKKIAVVGGGVAGCETAIMAAQRGHQVTIFEQSDHLGGQWKAAAVPIGKTDFADFLFWQSAQLKKYGVTVKLQTAVVAADLQAAGFDAVVVVSGSTPIMPESWLASGAKIVSALDVLLGQAEAGSKVVVIGGGLTGCETAEFLAANTRSRQVTLIEMQDAIAKDGALISRPYLLRRIKESGIDVRVGTKVISIDANTVTVEKGNVQSTIENVDTVVLALGVSAENSLLGELAESGLEIYAVGDANSVKNGFKNIREAFDLGVTI